VLLLCSLSPRVKASIAAEKAKKQWFGGVVPKYCVCWPALASNAAPSLCVKSDETAV
jgi:hypothetical protein